MIFPSNGSPGDAGSRGRRGPASDRHPCGPPRP
jgi:hypothetical protein